MSRCLHISIYESSGEAPRPVAAGGTGLPRPGDPAPDTVMPRIDDPAADTVMPRIDDPSPDNVIPRIDDPSAGSGGPRVDVYSSGGAACCAGAGRALHDGGAAPGASAYARPRRYSGFVIVRMAPGFGTSPAKDLWELAQQHRLTGLQAALEMPVKDGKDRTASEGPLRSRGLIEAKEDKVAGAYRTRELRELEEKAASTAFPPLHSLADYWRLDLRQHSDLVAEVVARLNRLPEVDLAYRELMAADPGAPAAGRLLEDQGYLGDAPAGIGAFEARKSLAGASPGLALCDLEQGWVPNHSGLPNSLQITPLFGANRAAALSEDRVGYHGTAVLGQLAADGTNAFGLQGSAARLSRFVLASHYQAESESDLSGGTNGHVAEAIFAALRPTTPGHLEAGDVLLLEVERDLLPAEVDDADFDAIRLASALGIVVIEAAGNGGFDLDRYTDPRTGRSLRRGSPAFFDSGAILVGAARAGLPHDRMSFSNFGSRVDCFAWGEAVTTCGYGNLGEGNPRNSYTNTFAGTSSASPIIAGAAALVQILHKERTGASLRPEAIRELLSDPDTGIRQGPNVAGFIGVMPDLQAIACRRLQILPDVYMRRHVGDDGSPLGPAEAISSSPDILVSRGAPAGEGREANAEAPGDAIDPQNPDVLYSAGSRQLYVRLRNRGLTDGDAKVQLFASYAATLITPERWMPLHPAPVPISPIEPGDTLVARPVPFSGLPAPAGPEWLPGLPPAIRPAYSFLAVQVREASPDAVPGFERTVLLPPGPPYFDWAELRRFLRGPGVAWRNVHPILAGDDVTLAFLFAGTPDQIRHFDFEVIQRLPGGASVTLKVPAGLAAKLYQRQPWIAGQPAPGDVVGFELPKRPRTAWRQVALAPGAYIHAALQVKTGKIEGQSQKKPLRTGHSLALRQLWHGEEVGRITWCFVDRT